MSTFADDLRAHLDAEVLAEPTEGEEPEPLRAPEDVDKILRLVGHLRRERAEAERVAGGEIATILEFLDARLAELDEQIAFHEARAHRYHQAVLAENPRRRTIKLPHGTLKATQQQPQWEWDETVFVPWAEAHLPEAIRQKEWPSAKPPAEIDKNAAKKLLTVTDEDAKPVKFGVDPKTMEIPPGVTVHVRGDKFDVIPPQQQEE